MTLQEYLLMMLEAENAKVTELIKIDNHICFTKLTIADLKNILKNNFQPVLLNSKYNFITDGEPTTIYQILSSYGLFIKNINLNNMFYGLNKWLIKNAIDYYADKGHNFTINIDLQPNYQIYKDQKESIVLAGFPEFTQETAKLLDQKVAFIINPPE